MPLRFFIRTSKVLIRLNVFFLFFLEGVQPQNVLIVFLFLTFVPDSMVPINGKKYIITPDERPTARNIPMSGAIPILTYL